MKLFLSLVQLKHHSILFLLRLSPHVFLPLPLHPLFLCFRSISSRSIKVTEQGCLFHHQTGFVYWDVVRGCKQII